MTVANDVVLLMYVDNTLLDKDRIVADLNAHLAQEFGDESRDRYWKNFEALRVELGYADYLDTLQRYRVGAMNDPRLLMMSSFLVDYPFAERSYPAELEVIAHLRRWGQMVILSDGDMVFQPRKVQQSGLWMQSRVHAAKGKEDRLSQWVMRIAGTRHPNVAAVALANKTARIAWALMTTGSEYRPDLVAA